MLTPLRSALQPARWGIPIIAMIHAVSLGVGALMVHSGNSFALDCRDSIVDRAHRIDPAARADDAGAHWRAAAA
jgi:hypothetical protein